MNDELRAAKRLRGIEGPTFHGIGGKRHISEREYADAITLAMAWLAEHPADDGEVVTAEWLKSIGFVMEWGEYVLSPIRFEPVNDGKCPWHICCLWDGHAIKFSTRGQVRQLLRALGIPFATKDNTTTG